MSLDLESDLIRDEGLRLKPYKDSLGILTIGVGRNLEDRGITKDEAIFLLKNDIALCKNQLKIYDWFNNLNDVRKNVIINMCFNMGINRLMLFKKTINAITLGDYGRASQRMLSSKWSRQVGERAVRLAKEMLEGK